MTRNILGNNFVAFVLLLISTSRSSTQNSIIQVVNPLSQAEVGNLTRVSAVVGGEADLPCDSRPHYDDALLLIVWYRDDDPVYSYDTRVSDAQAHWTDERLTGRALWRSYPNPSLHLTDILNADRAIYRCRVDFKISPTRNYRIALDVIELPNKPVIFDEFGKEISGKAGPYNEGEDFKIICSVSGGIPTPRIQWLQGDIVLATLGAHEVQTGARTLPLVIQNATRAHLSSIYTCVADNTLHASTQRTSVQLDLYLRPLSVDILSREHPLSAGRQAELRCRSVGARPPAIISWWLGSQKLTSFTKYKESEDGNETHSLLQWTPLKEHNGQVLVCRAEHMNFNRSVIESKLSINVYYVPEATMQLGAKMNPNDIEEGDDVYFGCEVDANPPAYKVVWEHNGNILQHNPSKGVILTGNTNLALRNISKSQAGKYSCTASNVEGDGRSKALQLQIVYKPLCKRREVRLIGAALQELSSVVCEVEAFPAPDTFEWTLNNSAGSIKINSKRFTVNSKEGKSVLTYSPVSDTHYGTLSCRATNLAGQQVEPCFYALVPATRPDPPVNCTVYNLTHDSLDLLCFPGHEGGLHCVYIVEVWSRDGLLMNASNDNPQWNLRRLGASKQLKIITYASNVRGRSDHISITVETSQQLSLITGQAPWDISWAIGGVLGAALTVALIFCFAFIATKLKNQARDYEVTIPATKLQKADVPKRNLALTNDDRNPDLIPQSKGVLECLPEPPPYAAVVAVPTPTTSHSHSTQSLAQRTHEPQSPSTNSPPHLQYPETQSDLGCARSLSGVNGSLRSHRDVVTTRTPLLATHQESCV